MATTEATTISNAGLKLPIELLTECKFLPYKYYGNEQGIQEYGYKETT